MALNLLAKKSPETAEMLSGMIRRGENPAEAMKRFASEGKINKGQLEELRSIYKMVCRMGLKSFKVPDSVWEEAESALTGVIKQDNLSDWF